MDFINIRVFFSKTGNAKYISHLDLYRAMARAVKRAALPVWFTEGFNPHIYMTFALPLALGIEGADEPVDLRLIPSDKTTELSEVTARLNFVMPEGVRVNRTALPVRNAADINKARYEITSPERERLDEFFSQTEIKIEKKTKRSAEIIDVKPLLSWDTGTLSLPAGNTLNINPWNVFRGFDNVNVKRTAILCGDGEVFK